MAMKRVRRRRFNRPPGQHSWTYKQKRKHLKLKINVNSLFNNHSENHFYTVKKHPTCLKLLFKRIQKPPPDGYRIINLNELQNHICHVTSHTAMCEKAWLCATLGRPTVKLIAEKKRQGLASILQVQCQGCCMIFPLETSPKIQTCAPHKRFDINIRAVWGTMVTGGGLSKLTECLGTMGIPCMSQPTFTSIEHDIAQWWCNVLSEEMASAGAEEKKLAEERNDFYQGVPAITVICDGGWSKRSHKHTYNASGRVAIIIGQATRKILFIGVRNKACYICDLACSQKKQPQQHTCYKNWEKSSQAMESDIIVEGFCRAEQDHGVRYMRLVGDGDSSVYARIQEQVPVWGPHVQKLECANHVCKCLRSNLEKLVDVNTNYKGMGKLTKNKRIRIVSAVRCAIRMRSEESDTNLAQKKLEHDIKNSVHHVFGNHDKCSDFCKKKPQQMDLDIEKDEDVIEEDDPLHLLVDDQTSYWTDGASLSAQEQSRLAKPAISEVDANIIKDVSIILERVASKSSRLLGNFTSNLAEAWMNIRAKFDGGKYFNRCNRGSWHARCYGGALRQNLGVRWSPSVWKKVTNTSPSSAFEHLYDDHAKKLALNQRLSARPVYKTKRWHRKIGAAKESVSKKAKLEYGPDSLKSVPDISKTELEEMMNDYKKKHINLTVAGKKELLEKTKEQSNCETWKDERRKRLTSSNFGDVCKRNPNIPVKPLVKRLLYSTFEGSMYTSAGLSAESATIQEYICEKAKEGDAVKIEPQGLCIHPIHSYLAASTDGLVTSATTGDQGLLEVKFLLQKKSLTLDEAVKKDKNFCLTKVNNVLKLKTNHNYYFQIQGQLNIFDKHWLDFVIRSIDPHQLHIERIFRDSELWEATMLPKLQSFYHKCILPELACPRNGKYPGIREPGIWHQSTKQTRASTQPVASTSSGPASRRPKRLRTIQFVGRHISHRWIVDEHKGSSKWYDGIVTDIKSGRDGDMNAVYLIRYASDDEIYEVDHLVEDYNQQSVKFTDI